MGTFGGFEHTRDGARTYGRTRPRTAAEPTLFLDFASATSLDPRITFSRGSQATLFDSTGTLVYAKQNLLSYSDDFADATWSKDNATVTGNAAIAPDGTLTADKLITNAAVTNGQTFRSVTLAALTTFTFSCFVKASEWSWVLLATRGPENLDIGAYFNLSAGTVGTVSAGVTASITPVGDGWYRCVVTRTTGTGATASRQRIYSTNADNTLSTGDGTSGIFIWGAQLNIATMEGGVTSSLTTYYPTTTAAYYAPRFDYNPSTLQPLGLLIEEQRTNSIRNNTMQGAVAGTPGTAPTNWFVTAAGGNLTSVEIVGIGAESGITYIDIRFVTSGAVNPVILFESTTQIVAANGQTWTSAIYNKLVNGSLTNVTVNNRIQYRDATGANLQAVDVVVTPTSAALSTQRNFNTATATNASTARITNGHLLTISAAADFTLRIGLPQLEQGAFATSVIPTTTTALTRNQDIASMTGTNFSSWYNASEGTVFCQYFPSAVGPATVQQTVFSISDGTIQNEMEFFKRANADVSTRFRVWDNGNNQVDFNLGTFTAANNKSAVVYKTNDFAGILNNGSVFTDASGIVPSAVNRLNIGSDQGSVNQLSGWISRIAYYPTRLPNATLQALTL